MQTKTILCYGDSNTYGYDPRSYFGSRYPENIRWTGILKKATGADIRNLGVPGREIPKFEYEMKQMQTVILRECTDAPQPAGLWIMLGTNDLLNVETVSAEEIAGRIRTLLGFLIKQELFLSEDLAIRVIAPPRLQQGTWVSPHALAESERLGKCIKKIIPASVAFTDAGEWKLPLCFDGAHLTEKGHRIFAEHMLSVIT